MKIKLVKQYICNGFFSLSLHPSVFTQKPGSLVDQESAKSNEQPQPQPSEASFERFETFSTLPNGLSKFVGNDLIATPLEDIDPFYKDKQVFKTNYVCPRNAKPKAEMMNWRFFVISGRRIISMRMKRLCDKCVLHPNNNYQLFFKFHSISFV